jgi:RNA polymerase-binding transcription factor DksA
MQSTDLQRYRRKLVEFRDRSRGELNRMIQVVLADARAAGEHDCEVSESIEKELALEHTEEAIRSNVLAALKRIDAGRYGRCECCGKSISMARLDVLPYTRYCVHCEQIAEGTYGR